MNYPSHYTANKAVFLWWLIAVDPCPAVRQMAKVRVTATVFFKMSEVANPSVLHEYEHAAIDNLVAKIIILLETCKYIKKNLQINLFKDQYR